MVWESCQYRFKVVGLCHVYGGETVGIEGIGRGEAFVLLMTRVSQVATARRANITTEWRS